VFRPEIRPTLPTYVLALRSDEIKTGSTVSSINLYAGPSARLLDICLRDPGIVLNHLWRAVSNYDFNVNRSPPDRRVVTRVKSPSSWISTRRFRSCSWSVIVSGQPPSNLHLAICSPQSHRQFAIRNS